MKHRHSGVQKRVFQEGGNDKLFQIPQVGPVSVTHWLYK